MNLLEFLMTLSVIALTFCVTTIIIALIVGITLKLVKKLTSTPR